MNVMEMGWKYVKKFNDDVMLTNIDVSVIFLIYGQFGAIRKLDSRLMVYNTYIFSNSNLLFSKS